MTALLVRLLTALISAFPVIRDAIIAVQAKQELERKNKAVQDAIERARKE